MGGRDDSPTAQPLDCAALGIAIPFWEASLQFGSSLSHYDTFPPVREVQG